MFRSLHMKLTLILLLLISSLMAVVGAFLTTSVTSFYINSFYQQMDDVFGAESSSFVSDLRSAAGGAQAADQLREMLDANAGQLGIDYRTRNYYVLDGTSGTYLTGSAEEATLPREQSPNLLTVRNAIVQGNTMTVGDASSISANYMDVAIPIAGGDHAYILYILDNKDTVSELNSQLFMIIMQAMLIGLLISVLLSFLLSKTMITPIERLTAGARRVAEGDFSNKIEVGSKDEIGVLTNTFNNMARQLQETIHEVENERNKLGPLFLPMTDGVVAFAADGTVIQKNPAAEEMLGRTIGPDADYAGLFGDIAALEAVLAVRQPDYLEGEREENGRSLEFFLAPFDQESLGGVLVLIHDVTTQRRNEEMRKEFVANVSHELRTPLTNIRSYTETLADSAGELPPEMEKNFLGVILGESDRMTRIVQDLLTLSRFDSGRSPLNLTRFSFTATLRDLYNAVILEAQRHGHQLTLDLPEDLPDIVADRERVLQVMMNVVSNAIKYTPDGGRIQISAGPAGNKVWMEVDDNGIGIPASDRGRIFERFYRVDKARSRESGGTGLGLSIAMEIIKQHKGSLTLVDKSGPGLRVRVELPVEGPDHV